jgi:predicted protein tyrosine phosphatase
VSYVGEFGILAELRVCSWKRAEELTKAGGWDAALALTRHEERTLAAKRAGIPLVLPIRDSMPWRRKDHLMGSEELERLASWARSLREGFRVLVYCDKGRSRSPAAAMIILALSGLLPEEKAAAKVFEIAPRSNPNGWILLASDLVLGTRLFHAAEKAGRVKMGF